MGSEILDLIFHAEASAFDEDGLGVMEQAVQDVGSESGVAIQDFGLAFVGLVGGADDGAAFVAFADDLEKKISAEFIDG